VGRRFCYRINFHFRVYDICMFHLFGAGFSCQTYMADSSFLFPSIEIQIFTKTIQTRWAISVELVELVDTSDTK